MTLHPGPTQSVTSRPPVPTVAELEIERRNALRREWAAKPPQETMAEMRSLAGAYDRKRQVIALAERECEELADRFHELKRAMAYGLMAEYSPFENCDRPPILDHGRGPKR